MKSILNVEQFIGDWATSYCGYIPEGFTTKYTAIFKDIRENESLEDRYELAKVLMNISFRVKFHALPDYICLLFWDKLYRIPHEIKDKSSMDHYHYIPYDRYSFLKILEEISSFSTKSFIDVGSGIGDKVLLANLFLECKYLNTRKRKYIGIEYNTRTFNISKNTISSLPGIKLVKGDAFDYDFSDIDIVYMYVPINNGERMMSLHEKVLKELSKGSIFIDVGMDILRNRHSYKDGGSNLDDRYLYRQYKYAIKTDEILVSRLYTRGD